MFNKSVKSEFKCFTLHIKKMMEALGSIAKSKRMDKQMEQCLKEAK